MSFDRDSLIEACRTHGVVARVVVAAVHGSAPREVGAAMLVWRGDQSGTIGGGALEYELAERARTDLTVGRYTRSRHALGPDMGQCCGGAVEIVTEVFDTQRTEALAGDMIAHGTGEMPLSIRRALAKARSEGERADLHCHGTWIIEPVTRPSRAVWIWGAGHVGQALVSVFQPFPDIEITWIDTAEARFPDEVPPRVRTVVATAPERLVSFAPPHAQHLIVTYSHAIDLALCDALLRSHFHFAGLIGSKTKWTRFRKRLMEAGHTPAQVSRITCPIGDTSLGKHPHAIAIGVAAAFLKADTTQTARTENLA